MKYTQKMDYPSSYELYGESDVFPSASPAPKKNNNHHEYYDGYKDKKYPPAPKEPPFNDRAVIYTDGQKELFRDALNWWQGSHSQPYVYSGKAGTGKTTVARKLIDLFDLKLSEVMCVALSGKAVTLLASKGLYARTIHSLIYNTGYENILDENGDVIMDTNGHPKSKFVFKLRPELNRFWKDRLKLIIVDELSMVNDNIMKDLLSFKVPVIGMGDLNQLPPVYGISSYMLKPNYVLNQIMRQEADSPVIQIANNILDYKPLIYGDYPNDCHIVKSVPLDVSLLRNYDVILTSTNSSRDLLNNYIRKNVIHLNSPLPMYGDKIICRQNDWNNQSDGMFLTNGTIGYIDMVNEEGAKKNTMSINFIPDYGIDSKAIFRTDLDTSYITAPYIDRKAWGIGSRTALKFEYGYAITVHLSQGSQYNRVLYFDEPFGGGKEMTKHLRYTAVSRAITSITICTTPPAYLIPRLKNT